MNKLFRTNKLAEFIASSQYATVGSTVVANRTTYYALLTAEVEA